MSQKQENDAALSTLCDVILMAVDKRIKVTDRNLQMKIKDLERAIRMASKNNVVDEQGNASEVAKRLETARQIALIGAAKGEALFDGSKDVAISTVLETLSNEEMEGMLI